MTSAPFLNRRVLIDTGAYYALAARRETHHPAAIRIEARMIAQHLQPFTTNFILAETHALILNRINRDTAQRILAAIRASVGTSVVRVSARDEQRAWQIIERYDDKAFTFTDATSFAVMERLRIRQAFTFDRNFTEYGLPILAP